MNYELVEGEFEKIGKSECLCCLRKDDLILWPAAWTSSRRKDIVTRILWESSPKEIKASCDPGQTFDLVRMLAK